MRQRFHPVIEIINERCSHPMRFGVGVKICCGSIVIPRIDQVNQALHIKFSDSHRGLTKPLVRSGRSVRATRAMTTQAATDSKEHIS